MKQVKMILHQLTDEGRITMKAFPYIAVTVGLIIVYFIGVAIGY